MRKLLYIDVPFSGMPGEDKRRSEFIWDIISSYFDADLLLLKTPEFLTTSVPQHDGFDQIFTLTTQNLNPLKPKTVYQFSRENKNKFIQILTRKRYEIIVLRHTGSYELAVIAEQQLPDCRIVFDVDVLLSRLTDSAWQQNPTFANRQNRIEYFKLKYLENILFHKPYQFFFANNQERDFALNQYNLSPDNPAFHTMPAMMPKPEQIDTAENLTEQDIKLLDDKYILFFGTLDKAANIDAFQYLATEIYPRVSKKLQDKDIKIYIIGENRIPIYDQLSGGRLKVIGAVPNLSAYIEKSLFVILPMRIASETGSRILQTAVLKKAVLTTSTGALGFDFTADEIAIEDKTDDFCQKLIAMLQTPDKTAELGSRLFAAATETYSRDSLRKHFLDFLTNLGATGSSDENVKKLKIAIVTNGCYPETGKVESRIWLQIKQLAERYEVSVFCPRRIDKPKVTEQDGCTVYRYFDVFNYPVQFPNPKAKTLCPQLFVELLRGNYDIIQCYPGINYNNVLAFIAAKIKGVPVIMCTFDYLDYASNFRENGIDPDILANQVPGWKESFMLKHLDYIFASSEKEVTFYHRFNNSVEYAPIPVLASEYSVSRESPRPALNIPAESFVFLCLGKISYIKGQDIALKAFAKALSGLPGARLVFAGRVDCEPDFFADMEAFVRREMLSEQVLFTGAISGNDALAWLQSADILVIPARFCNTCTAVVESWMCDTPVLQSDAVDPNLIMEDGNGYMFDSGDVDDLAAQMINAFAHRTILPRLAAHGKVLAMEKYSIDYLINLYARVYRQLTSVAG